MARWSRRVTDPFRETFYQVSWFGPVVSGLVVGMLVNILTTALTVWGGLGLGWGALFALMAATVAYVYVHYFRERRRRRTTPAYIADLPDPEKCRGLIFLFSREDTLREAIKYHRPVLEHCWLLVTPEMQEKAGQAVTHFPEVMFTLHPIPDALDTPLCYRTVRDVYLDEAARYELPPERVIADITGGTKPMTMGMIVACLEGGRRIEHIPTEYDALGKPIGPLPPKEIRIKAEEVV